MIEESLRGSKGVMRSCMEDPLGIVQGVGLAHRFKSSWESLRNHQGLFTESLREIKRESPGKITGSLSESVKITRSHLE